MNNETNERAAFDHWYSNEGQFPKSVERSRDGTYMLIGAQSAWNAWQARASAATQAVPREKLAERLKEMIGEYWALAYAEGQEGREHDTEDAAAGRMLSAINEVIAALAVPPVALPAMADEPLPAWPDVLGDAEQLVRQKPTWSRFIKGTPLENDVPVWIAAFSQRVLQRERARVSAILAASAAPAPEQMQPNAGAEQDHLAAPRAGSVCGVNAADGANASDKEQSNDR